MRALFDTDSWRETFESFSRHKLRTALTAFGVFWGIFMLVNLLGMARGLENGFNASFAGNKKVIYFWAARPSTLPYKGLPIGRKIVFTTNDIKAIAGRFPEVDFIAPFNGYGEQVFSRKHKTATFMLEGVVGASAELRGYRKIYGRYINHLDSTEFRNVAAIGSEVYSAMFDPGEDPTGKYIQVLGTPIKVIGVFEPKGIAEWQQQDRRRVFLPRTTLAKLTNMGDSIHWLTVALQDHVDANKLEKEIGAFLKQRHQFHPDEHAVVGSYNSQVEFDKRQRLFMAIQAFSWVVAVGTIFAGAIGASNIMLITVKERTKEIGLRKALGAAPAAIIFSVVKESLVLSFIAGYLGLVAGVLTIEAVASLAAQGPANSNFSNPEVSFTTALVAIAVLLFASALAAFIPARKAANIDPVVALRDE